MADLRIYQTADGGEVDWKNGEPLTADGLESAALLSLFGGNQEDSGLTDGEPNQWWANVEMSDPAQRMRSQLQAVLRGMPCVPYNLNRAEDAAMADLAWMTTELEAKVSVSASIPALEQLGLHVEIQIGNTKYPFDFTSRWAFQ